MSITVQQFTGRWGVDRHRRRNDTFYTLSYYNPVEWSPLSRRVSSSPCSAAPRRGPTRDGGWPTGYAAPREGRPSCPRGPAGVPSCCRMGPPPR